MKNGIKKRILSLVLCISMILPMIAQPLPVYSVEAGDAVTNYGAAIGAVAEFKNTGNVILDIEPVSTGGKSISVDLLPTQVVIKNYYYDEVNDEYWYQIDSAPGNKSWPTDYAEYHWAYADDLTIIAQNGMTSIFDVSGNTVSTVTLPLYDKISLSAESSLQGSVKYQWQIEYESGKWVDIYGEDESEITLSIGMIATLLVDDSVNIRCVSTSASKTATSGAIEVTVDFSSIDDGEDEEDPVEPTVPTLEIQMDGASADSVTTTYGNHDFKATLTAATTLTGSLTYKWEVLTDVTNDLWSTLSTAETCTFGYGDMQFKYYDTSSDISTIRLTVSNGTDSLTDTFLVYRIAEVYVTNSTGDTTGTVDVTVSGSLPDDASLNLGDASDTTIGGVEASEIALALDVTITQYGSEWQPAEGETVRVSIPAAQLGLSDGQYFTVYHIHDGATELLGPFKVENGYVTFEIDGFSVVVISTNYGAAIGGVAEFAGASAIMDISPVSFAGVTIWVEKLPSKIVIENYYFDNYLGKLFYEIDAAPGYTWPAEYANLHWCYSDALTNIDVNGSMGMFDENGEPVSFVELPLSAKPTYTVQTSLTGDVKYQWQICYDVNNYLWMDIDGQTDASITLSYAMLASVLDENGMCAVRCMVSNALKTQEGYPMVIAFNDGSEEDAPTVENNASITVNGEETNSAELADKDYYWDSENGVEVTLENGILDLSVNTNLTGDNVTYQWQGLSDSEWVNLSTGKDYQLTFSDLMFAGAYSGSTACIRVVVTQGETVVESEQLIVTIVEAVVPVATYSMRSMARSASANAGIATAAEESVTITVQFINGQTGEAMDRGEDVFNIQYGSDLKAYADDSDRKLPVIEGYSPYLGDDTTEPLPADWILERTNVTEDETIIIKYWPAKVNYTVIYYWQNFEDDEYKEHERVTGQQFTGSMPEIDEKSYEGFYRLLYENVPCASDGSTVIEVYYDRLYFKMLFDLDGGYGVQPVYARYGTPITVTNPTKAGYNFMGWNALNGPHNTSNDEDTAEIGAFTDIKIPAEHTNYKAIWKASDAAKVTVVIWGQKADNSNDLTDPNSYAYMSETEDGVDLTNLHFNAKPGTSVTYNPATGGYICGYTEEHKHGAGECSATCGKEEHTHSAVGGDCYELTCTTAGCTQHGVNCYGSGIGSEFVAETWQGYIDTTRVKGTSSNGYIGIKQEAEFSLFGGMSWKDTEEKYIYIEGTWYEYTGTANVDDTVQSSCHVHNDACYTFDCDIQVHAHTDACYAGCTKEEHTHSSDCSLTIPMDSDLWEFDHATPVTVAADGTSTLNVYYRRTKFTLTFVYDGETVATIYEKWGTNIKARFDKIETDTIAKLSSNEALAGWRDSTTNKYTNYVGIMPKINKTFTANIEGANEDSNTMTYYFENLSGDYEEGFKIVFTGNGYSVTTDEYYEIEGFEINKSKSTSTGTTCKGAKFYYDRKDFNLVFDNYGNTFKNASVLYEAPLSGYDPEENDEYKVPDSLAPAYYQPGSVEFAGWYAAPQTPGDFNFENVTSFDFANSTMPASDLILYAWWKPVSHNVRFFYGEEYIELNQVYSATVDGTTITYDYDVPHGSPVQNPYSPPNDPTKGKYIFVGWFYRDDNGQEQMWDFANTTVTRDTDIYAKWSSNTLMDYEVKFMWKNPATGEEIEIAAPIQGSALGGNSKTFDAKGNAELYADYQTGYFPKVQSHTITIDLDDTSNNSFIFWYEKIAAVPYTVRYIDRATSEAVVGTDGKTYSEITYPNNSKAIVTETALMIPGYLPEKYQITHTVTPNGENIITFYYNKDEVNGMYVVHYWTENLDGTFSEHSVFNGKGVGGSTVNANIKDIENFTYIQGYNNTATGDKEVLSGQITVGSVLELHVFYERNSYPYKVQYMEEGTTKELAPSKIVTGKLWEELVTESAIAIENYTLKSDEEISIQIAKDTEKPSVNIITFYYEENKVTLNYVAVGPDGAVNFGAVAPGSETVKIKTGTAKGSTAKAASNAYKFVGWYSDADCTNKIGDVATYVPTKADDALWVDGTTYYAKFEYNLTSLTIDKAYPDGADYSMDVNQSFLFDVVEVDENGDVVNGGISITVTIHGDGSITIDGLTVGHRYRITEKTNWSWRYEECTVTINEGLEGATGANSATVKLTANASTNTVTFTNTRGNEQWLDGDSWCNNIFSGPKS